MRPEHFERPALLKLIQSPRRTTRQTLAVATIFAVQAVVCALLLMLAYNKAHAAGVNWAIVSAILVLQPGIEQSISASAIRIAANLIGAGTGLAVGWAFGTGAWQVPVALVIATYICEFLRLDLGLRTACVSVVIVMLANDGRVTTTSLERVVAVLVGCVIAVILQIAFDRVTQLVAKHRVLNGSGGAQAANSDQE